MRGSRGASASEDGTGKAGSNTPATTSEVKGARPSCHPDMGRAGLRSELRMATGRTPTGRRSEATGAKGAQRAQGKKGRGLEGTGVSNSPLSEGPMPTTENPKPGAGLLSQALPDWPQRFRQDHHPTGGDRIHAQKPRESQRGGERERQGQSQTSESGATAIQHDWRHQDIHRGTDCLSGRGGSSSGEGGGTKEVCLTKHRRKPFTEGNTDEGGGGGSRLQPLPPTVGGLCRPQRKAASPSQSGRGLVISQLGKPIDQSGAVARTKDMECCPVESVEHTAAAKTAESTKKKQTQAIAAWRQEKPNLWPASVGKTTCKYWARGKCKPDECKFMHAWDEEQ